MREANAKPLKNQQKDGKQRILEAALAAFSRVGFDGTSLRQIAERAATQHQLIVYHFGTKEALWKAVVDALCADAFRNARDSIEAARARGPGAALRELITSYVRFTATWPEFHRIVTFEGSERSERLEWLIENYAREAFAINTRLIGEAQAAGLAREGDPARLHYALIGLVTSSFAMAPEFRALTGRDPFEASEVETVIAMACEFIGV